MGWGVLGRREVAPRTSKFLCLMFLLLYVLIFTILFYLIQLSSQKTLSPSLVQTSGSSPDGLLCRTCNNPFPSNKISCVAVQTPPPSFLLWGKFPRPSVLPLAGKFPLLRPTWPKNVKQPLHGLHLLNFFMYFN